MNQVFEVTIYRGAVWKTVRWTLRQRRYARLAVAAAVLALGCIAAGTWQIQRFAQSVHDNRALDRNAHAAGVALTASLAPLTGAGSAPGRDQVRFRTVTVSGRYLPTTSYVPGKIVNGVGGFDAVTPLRTTDAVVIVDRGFVPATAADRPGPLPALPTGAVTITGRLDTASSAHAATDPAAFARALGAPVHQVVLMLAARQPGSAGLVSPGSPDLSNPAGGAYEAQHFAYIIQWYVFAILALIAPFAIARTEVREAQKRFLGLDTGEQEFGVPTLEASERPADAGIPGADVAVRAGGTLVATGRDAPELVRAQRLADRYGRALSLGDEVEAPATSAPLRRTTPVGGLTERVPDSAQAPHRSHDAYQGSYNDYLWQLGLADGSASHDVAEPPATEPPDTGPRAVAPPIIDVDPVDED